MKKKGNRIILFFIAIISIIWISSGILIAKPFIIDNNFSYSQTSEFSNTTTLSTNTTTLDNAPTLSNIVFNVKEDSYSNIYSHLYNSSIPTYKINEKNINIPILIYHEVTTNLPKNDIYDLYILASRFEENIVTLLDAGYTFITFDDLYYYYNGEIGLPEKVVLITSDDGWKRELY